MKRVYKKTRIGSDRLATIAKANEFITTYQAQGMLLSIRQLFYRFIATDSFPDSWKDPAKGGSKNTERNYKKLIDVMTDARMSGLVDWEAIEDRTREVSSVPHWNTPGDVVQAAADAFRLDKWADQPRRVLCFVEKDALEGIVTQAAHAKDVAVFSCRGYSSLSSIWEMAQRLKVYIKAGQRPVILHLGDHDPSGIDMTRDISDRLNEFTEWDWLYENMPGRTQAVPSHIRQSIEDRFRKYGPIEDDDESLDLPSIKLDGGVYGKAVQVIRIALTMDQVQEYNPPPNPAKVTDSRFKSYQDQFGDECYELDALEPQVLLDLISSQIDLHLDVAKYNAMFKTEKKHREDLATAAKRWTDVSTFVNTMAKAEASQSTKKKGK